MAARVRMIDGREVTVLLSGKRAAEALAEAAKSPGLDYVRFASIGGQRVWISAAMVSVIEDRPELV